MRSALACLAAFAAFGLSGLSASAQDAAAPDAMTYTDVSPAYRFFPGDEIEIVVFSAPELTRTVMVAPDGRVALPLIGAVRAADLTAEELQAALVTAYSNQLRHPELSVVPRSYASRQVFVGGEVARPSHQLHRRVAQRERAVRRRVDQPAFLAQQLLEP